MCVCRKRIYGGTITAKCLRTIYICDEEQTYKEYKVLLARRSMHRYEGEICGERMKKIFMALDQMDITLLFVICVCVLQFVVVLFSLLFSL